MGRGEEGIGGIDGGGSAREAQAQQDKEVRQLKGLIILSYTSYDNDDHVTASFFFPGAFMAGASASG